jgi:hypothetical protein
MDAFVSFLTFINDNIGAIVIGLLMYLVFAMLEKTDPDEFDPDVIEATLLRKNQELLSLGTMDARLEEIDGVLFLFNDLTDEFICQGRNIEEINQNFGLRFPNLKSMTVTGEHNLLVRVYVGASE